MIDFLKNLFKKKEIIKEEVELKALSEWFNNKTKNRLEEVNKLIKEEIKNLIQEAKVLEQNLETLQDATPDKKLKVMPKVKQTVDGHRNNYIKRIKLFLKDINESKELDYISAQQYCKELDEQLNDVAKSTTKSYYATQHLYYKELEEVTKNLKEVSKSIKNIKDLLKESRIKTIEKIKKDIKEIEKGKTTKIELNKEIEQTKKRKKESEELKEQSEKNLKEIKEGEEYKRYNSLLEKIKEAEDNKRKKEGEFLDLFSPLYTALKKYERISLEDGKLIINYLTNAVQALIQDKDLKIMGILEKIKRNVESGSLELKDKKKIKTLKTIENINRDELKTFIEEIQKINKEKEEIDKETESAKIIVEKERKETEKLNKIRQNTEQIKDKLETLEKKAKEMDLEKTKKDIINNIKEILNIELEIK